jgi:putative ABC transport system ATP-binding protein
MIIKSFFSKHTSVVNRKIQLSNKRLLDSDGVKSPQDFTNPLIELRDVVKVYKSHAGEFRALKGVNAQFYPGQFVSIIGKSGSGKSTLLNMITGIDRPTSGKILIDGTYLQDLSESEFSDWRGKNLGIVFQFFQLLPMLSLQENTILPMDFSNMFDPSERESRALELLGLVGLEDFAHKPPAAVSSGQEQCAAIARALANDPPILVADEPTGNLDSKTAEIVLTIIDELVKQGKTILVVTHDEAVAKRASRTLVISDGELVDEDISRALPLISHRSMLNLSHLAIEMVKLPGEVFCDNLDRLPGLMLVVQGSFQCVDALSGKVTNFKSGSLLTRENLSSLKTGGSTIRASNKQSLRIKVISNEDLLENLAASKSLRAAIQQLNSDVFMKLPEHSRQSRKGTK